jgi:hypothetical protein
MAVYFSRGQIFHTDADGRFQPVTIANVLESTYLGVTHRGGGDYALVHREKAELSDGAVETIERLRHFRFDSGSGRDTVYAQDANPGAHKIVLLPDQPEFATGSRIDPSIDVSRFERVDDLRELVTKLLATTTRMTTKRVGLAPAGQTAANTPAGLASRLENGANAVVRRLQELAPQETLEGDLPASLGGTVSEELRSALDRSLRPFIAVTEPTHIEYYSRLSHGRVATVEEAMALLLAGRVTGFSVVTVVGNNQEHLTYLRSPPLVKPQSLEASSWKTTETGRLIDHPDIYYYFERT